MKLELKHIAPYLPYDLRIFHSAFMFRNNWNENEIGTMAGITDVISLKLDEITFDIVMKRDKDSYKLHDSRGHFKLILRPISDLTKEIEHNGEKFVPIEKVDKGGNMELLECLNDDEFEFPKDLDLFPYWMIVSLLEWHFDIYGLIENGLAIDINTLEK